MTARRPPNARDWSNSQIEDFYDRNPDVTLRQLAAMTGKRVEDLKLILTGGY